MPPGIRIDRSAPTTTASLTDEPNAEGWFRTAPTIRLAASDALSGVAGTYYSLSGGEARRSDGTVTLTEEGVHTVRYWSTDEAGNVGRATNERPRDRSAPTRISSQRSRGRR